MPLTSTNAFRIHPPPSPPQLLEEDGTQIRHRPQAGSSVECAVSEDGTPRELRGGMMEVLQALSASEFVKCDFFRNGQFCSVDPTSSLEAWNWGALLRVVFDRLNFC